MQIMKIMKITGIMQITELMQIMKIMQITGKISIMLPSIGPCLVSSCLLLLIVHH